MRSIGAVVNSLKIRDRLEADALRTAAELAGQPCPVVFYHVPFRMISGSNGDARVSRFGDFERWRRLFPLWASYRIDSQERCGYGGSGQFRQWDAGVNSQSMIRRYPEKLKQLSDGSGRAVMSSAPVEGPPVRSASWTAAF